MPLPLRKIEDLHACKLCKSEDITLSAYQGKVTKHVLILSTMHKDITIANNAKKKPETVSSYNEAKYGVDIVDQLAKNTHAKLAHKDGQYIVFKTYWIWLLSMPWFFTKRLPIRRFFAGPLFAN